jgi:hypothetical protein
MPGHIAKINANSAVGNLFLIAITPEGKNKNGNCSKEKCIGCMKVINNMAETKNISANEERNCCKKNYKCSCTKRQPPDPAYCFHCNDFWSEFFFMGSKLLRKYIKVNMLTIDLLCIDSDFLFRIGPH